MERARHDGQAVRRRVGVEAADRAGHRHAFRVVFLPQIVERHGELGPRHRSVAAEAARQADMVMAALDACVGVAEIAGDAGADRHRPSGFHQARRLLDVQLEIGGDARRIEEAGAGTQCLRIAAAFGDVLGQRAAGVDAAHIQRAVRQRAECAAAADVGDLEPDALLGADAHHRDVAVGCGASLLQRRHGDQAGDHAGGAVEVAAMRHGVEMRADDDTLRRADRGRAASCRGWRQRRARCAGRAAAPPQ